MTRQSLAIGLPIFARQVKCYVIKQRGITITMASANESFHPWRPPLYRLCSWREASSAALSCHCRQAVEPLGWFIGGVGG